MSTPPNTPSDTSNHPTYYNQPVIRSGHWAWQIIVYFWIGGIAGVSYVISVIASLVGEKEDEEIGRWGRYISIVGMLLSPILLIWDLGKPSRFLNMLRIFKPNSPMSMGTWGVVTLSGFVGISAVLQAAQDRRMTFISGLFGGWKRVAEPIGALLGLFMASYTGILISNTAVPLWARNRKTNAPIFLSSAFANAAAMLSLLLAITGRGTRRTEEKLAQLQLGATITESALLVHELNHLGPYLRKPFTEGKSSNYFYGSVATGIVLPTLMGNPRARWLKILKAILTLVGGLLFRAAIIEGGHESADDPQAYHLFNAMEARERGKE